ncbi:uncharacterized protein LOC126845322 [Adelges cooleyi]|uniref:uncharacterized protein LOC126845322 n=1 Tax=Adelges cooleyi TaxID=133065 RepID=UPI0021800886|nr:uncharacterized protein LOC126845322 [Adelges cooleyi]
MFRKMIQKIDEMVVLVLANLSLINNEFPITTYDNNVSETLEEFKRFYSTLFFDNDSGDKIYHDSIISATENNMNTALRRLGRFYDDFCRPNENHKINGIRLYIRGMRGIFEPLDVMRQIKDLIDFNVNSSLSELWDSVGFEYDAVNDKTRVTYVP